MTFKRLAEYFQKLESTSLRLQMTEILSTLFKEASVLEIRKLTYLLQGRVVPLFEAVEFGIADRMMIRAVAESLNFTEEKVTKVFKEDGDLGIAVEKLKNADSPNTRVNKQKLSILDVYEILYKIATSGGEGSQDIKIKLLADLIKEVDSLSARYVARIPLGKMRLGFSDMTVLDALSWMITGTKEHRTIIEKAYNVRSDLGYISEVVKKEGVEVLENIQPVSGTPIRMARAERMVSGADIIEKIGKCAIEPKYDGFRLQAHFKNNKVVLFSRNQENVTHMYPDIVSGVKKQIKSKEAIFEGEAIGINTKTGAYLPFQETVQRKRKYDIETKALEIPLRLFAFDCLSIGNRSLINETYLVRRKTLKSLIGKGEIISLAEEETISDAQRLEVKFADAVSRGLEGVMAKKLEGTYRAGSRDFNWIKYKKSYATKLSDTIDAVVMGFDFGQGKRMSFGIGDFLIGVYDDKKEAFVTIAKIGTGLTDEEWKILKAKSEKLRAKNKPENYDVDKMMYCDVWIKPEIIVEIRADEITRSPVHTAGRVMGPSKSGSAFEVNIAGFALRFPRLERFREDKSPTDATTIKELENIFKQQTEVKEI